MTSEDFQSFLRRLSEYYGLDKIVSPQRFKLWFERIEKIPAQAIRHITHKFFEEKETIPRNIPKWMKEYFHDWLSSNPEKAASHVKTDCFECGSEGLNYYIDHSGSYKIWRMAVCPFCENWKYHIGSVAMQKLPVRSKDDLYKEGHTVYEIKSGRDN